MKSESEKRRLKVFIGALVIIALVVNVFIYSLWQNSHRSVPAPTSNQPLPQSTQPTTVPTSQTAAHQQEINQEAAARAAAQQAAEAKAAAQQAAEKKARYLARYLNPGFARKSGFQNVAIAAQFQDDAPDRTIQDALADHLQNPQLVLFTSFFKPAFYADGLFQQIFSGSTQPVYSLELTNTLDALVLAHEQVRYTTNGPDLDNVITANEQLEVAFLPFSVMRREQSWTYQASGAGFSPTAAHENAQKRLLKQIGSDTHLSLLSASQNSEPSYP